MTRLSVDGTALATKREVVAEYTKRVGTLTCRGGASRGVESGARRLVVLMGRVSATHGRCSGAGRTVVLSLFSLFFFFSGRGPFR